MTANLSISLSQTHQTLSNMLLVAGDGRNVGKTYFACQLIRYLSKKHKVTGIKTSPHLHAFQPDDLIIHQDENCIIIQEKKINKKDSSLMLQAGATKVFFIMAKQENLEKAFKILEKELDDSIIIAESGGLNEFIIPGKFIFIKDHYETIKKQQYLKYKPLIITRQGDQYDLTIEEIIQDLSISDQLVYHNKN